jgi:hypothetical protein
MLPMLTSSHRPALKLVGSSTRNVKVLQLKVELQGVRPKVWRRVLVPSSIRLPLLHVVLLRTMGWDGGHLHEFEFDQANYGVPDPDWGDPLLVDESKVTLNKALGETAIFTWVYDFGDAWRHKIKVERVDTVPATLKLQFPMCLAGSGACPPEDVGGATGYDDFLQAISNPDHPEHPDMTAWIGRPFDPNAFSVQEAQDRLYEIKL